MKKQVIIRPIYFAGITFLLCLLFTVEALTCKHLDYVFDFVGYGGTFKNHDLCILGIPAYWFMMLSGLAVCIYSSFAARSKYGFNKFEAILFPVIFLLISLLGGKLLYIIENFSSVSKNGISLDGLSLYGAIFLFPVVSLIVSAFKRYGFWEILDYCTPFGLILLACVRSGCFINGCCGAVTIWSGENPIILPVQLIEVTLDLIILDLCHRNFIKRPGVGFSYPFFMMSYGFCRFFLEFLRKDTGYGQIFSLVSIVIGAVLFALAFTGWKKRQSSKNTFSR